MTTSDKWMNAARAMEKRANVAGYIITNDKGELCGKVQMSFGHAVLAVAWMPGAPGCSFRHHYGRAAGGGYDRATAAMGGASLRAPDGSTVKLVGEGLDWRTQIEMADYRVYQAC